MTELKNSVYKFVESHEYLLTPLTNAALGFSVGGFYGALVGFGVGALDEGLLYNGITEQRYLSATFMGGATLTSFRNVNQVSMTNEIQEFEYTLATAIIYTFQASKNTIYTVMTTALGASLGLAVATGVIQEYPIIIQATKNAVLGSQLYGLYGSLGGIACSALDSGLASYNLTSYTHCSSWLEGLVFAKYTLPVLGYAEGWVENNARLKTIYTQTKDYLPYVWQSIIPFYTAYTSNTEQNATLPVLKLAQDLEKTYSSVVNKTEVDAIIEKQILTSVGLDLTKQKVTLILYEQFDVLRSFAFQSGLDANSEVKKEFLQLLPNIFKNVASQIAQQFLSGYFSFKLKTKIEDRVLSELFSGENMLKLQQSSLNAESLIDRINQDVSIIVEGLNVVTSAISRHALAILSTKFIIDYNIFDIVVYTSGYNVMKGTITKYLATMTTSISEQVDTQNSRLIKINKGILRQCKDISLNDATNFEFAQISKAAQELRELQVSKSISQQLQNTWDGTKGWLDWITPLFFALLKVINKTLPLQCLLKSTTSVGQVTAMLAWENENANAIAQTELSISKFNELVGMIRDNTGNPEHSIKYHINNGNALVIDSVNLKYNQTNIVSIDKLVFEQGMTYALTGKSGCGKSSLLFKIKGLEHDGIIASGGITYPENSNVVFVTQNDYIPLESTLYEVIMVPRTPAEAENLKGQYLDRVKHLMRDLGIHNMINSLDLKKDWGTTLSGGEKKKIALMRAILQDPDILIMDEVFNGMDKGSSQLAQHVIKKSLPNAIILIVDHHANDNNYNGFYDQRVHFENKTTSLMYIAPNDATISTEEIELFIDEHRPFELLTLPGQCYANESVALESSFCPSH
jgi:ABC-type uncharacterized transport system fused permease/ATPase subunit